MKKAKQRDLTLLSSSPLTSMELAVIDKEKSRPKSTKLDKLSTCKSGLELAGLQPCRWGDHNPNFGNKPLNMYR